MRRPTRRASLLVDSCTKDARDYARLKGYKDVR